MTEKVYAGITPGFIGKSTAIPRKIPLAPFGGHLALFSLHGARGIFRGSREARWSEATCYEAQRCCRRRRGVASGVVASGVVASGVVASGGVALGGVASGGVAFNLSHPASTPAKGAGVGVRERFSGFLSYWFRFRPKRALNAPPGPRQGGRKGAAVPRAGVGARERPHPAGGGHKWMRASQAATPRCGPGTAGPHRWNGARASKPCLLLNFQAGRWRSLQPLLKLCLSFGIQVLFRFCAFGHGYMLQPLYLYQPFLHGFLYPVLCLRLQNCRVVLFP